MKVIVDGKEQSDAQIILMDDGREHKIHITI